MRGREVLIVDGKMGTFGSDNCRVMMQFLLNGLYGALQRQQQLPEEERVRVALKVDEAHLILNESFADAMATLRSGGPGGCRRVAVRRADPGPEDPGRDDEPAAPALHVLDGRARGRPGHVGRSRCRRTRT